MNAKLFILLAAGLLSSCDLANALTDSAKQGKTQTPNIVVEPAEDGSETVITISKKRPKAKAKPKVKTKAKNQTKAAPTITKQGKTQAATPPPTAAKPKPKTKIAATKIIAAIPLPPCDFALYEATAGNSLTMLDKITYTNTRGGKTELSGIWLTAGSAWTRVVAKPKNRRKVNLKLQVNAGISSRVRARIYTGTGTLQAGKCTATQGQRDAAKRGNQSYSSTAIDIDADL